MSNAATKKENVELVRHEGGRQVLESVDAFRGILNAANLSEVDRAMMTARAISEIRDLLTDAVMNEWIMPLMNTGVGFDTDHNSAKGWSGSPYPLATVRECCIEAILHGLPMIGNAWNIIAGRMYVRKEGFEGLLRGRVRFTSSVKIVPSEARSAADAQGGGYCSATATVKYKHPDSAQDAAPEIFTASYSVRVNAKNKVPVEATEGKALRKGYRDLWHALTGALVPEGQTGDVYEIPPAAAIDPRPVARRDRRGTGQDLLSSSARANYEAAIQKVGRIDEAVGILGLPGEWVEDDMDELAKLRKKEIEP